MIALIYYLSEVLFNCFYINREENKVVVFSSQSTVMILKTKDTLIVVLVSLID